MHDPQKALWLGLTIVVAFVVGLTLLSGGSYDGFGAFLLAPILFGISLPILARQARREGDRTLFWLLVVALVLKLGGAVARHYVVADVYGRGDALGYHEWGVTLSEGFRHGDFTTELATLSGTNFMRFLTGLLYTVTGPTLLGGFLVFSWLGFWGLFLFYRAFVLAVPMGRARNYARLVFFFPSLVFWPSSIGKEAWMMFTLGIAAYGAAHVLRGRTGHGLMWAVPGLWLASLVRAHVAGLMGVAVAGALLMRKPRAELRELGPMVKGVSIVAVAIISWILVVQADAFLQERGIDTDQGIVSTVEQVQARSDQGGSKFVPSILRSPARAPVAVLTVLFRPLPFEAHNAQALLASLESVFLLGLCFYRFRWGLAALRSVRRSPFVAFALLYAGLFVVAFSGFANFGNLARQRVQLLPLFLVLLCIPPRSDPSDEREVGAEGDDAMQSA